MCSSLNASTKEGNRFFQAARAAYRAQTQNSERGKGSKLKLRLFPSPLVHGDGDSEIPWRLWLNLLLICCSEFKECSFFSWSLRLSLALVTCFANFCSCSCCVKTPTSNPPKNLKKFVFLYMNSQERKRHAYPSAMWVTQSLSFGPGFIGQARKRLVFMSRCCRCKFCTYQSSISIPFSFSWAAFCYWISENNASITTAHRSCQIQFLFECNHVQTILFFLTLKTENSSLR